MPLTRSEEHLLTAFRAGLLRTLRPGEAAVYLALLNVIPTDGALLTLDQAIEACAVSRATFYRSMTAIEHKDLIDRHWVSGSEGCWYMLGSIDKRFKDWRPRPSRL